MRSCELSPKGCLAGWPPLERRGEQAADNYESSVDQSSRGSSVRERR